MKSIRLLFYSKRDCRNPKKHLIENIIIDLRGMRLASVYLHSRTHGLDRARNIKFISSPSYIGPATTQIDPMQQVFKLERKGERELVDLDKVVDHQTSPGDPSHAAIADEVHYNEAR